MNRSPPARSPTRFLRAGAWLTLSALAGLLALAGVAMLALPWLDDDPRWAARWLSETLQRDVELAALEITIENGVPVLRLSDVRIRAPAGSGRSGLALQRVQVELSALQSIRHARLHPRRVSIIGADISLRRDTDGLSVEGLGQQHRPAREALGAVLLALPEDCEFTLHQARLSVHAAGRAPAAPRIILSPVSVHLARANSEVRLSLRLRTEGRGSLRAQGSWRSGDDPLSAMALSVNTTSLPLQRIAEALAITLPEGLQGNADLELDGQLRDAGLSSARGSLRVSGLRIVPAHADAPTPPASRITTLFDLARVQQKWQLNLLRVSLHEGGAQGTSRSSARVRSKSWDSGPYHLELDAMALSDLRRLSASLAPALNEKLDALVKQGRLEDIQVSIPSADAPLSAVQLEVGFEDVVLREALTPARLTPLSGRLTLHGSSGSVHLQPVSLTLPSGPGQRTQRITAEGTLAFSIDREGLSLRALGLDLFDARTHAEVNGTLRWNHADGSMVSNLAGHIDHISSSDLVKYIAAGLSNSKLIAWLRRGIPAGDARNVEVAVLGTSHSAAEVVRGLRIRGDFQGLQLEYAAGWPGLTDLRGQLWLHWPELGFKVDAGNVSGNSIEHAAGRISDVTDPHARVRVEGKIAGSTENGAAFLLGSPLKRRFAGLLSQLNSKGEAELELGLDIPIAPSGTRVDGTLLLDNNSIAVPSLRSDLEQVRGTIRFSEDGLQDGALEASYLGQAITASLDGSRSKDLVTALKIRGRTTPSGLIKHLHAIGALDSPRSDNLPLLRRLAGETAWIVELHIPSARNPDRSLALSVRSDLGGMSLDLPAPLGKSRDEARTLEVRTRIDGDARRVFRITYGALARAQLEVHARNNGYQLMRAGVRFGGEPASLPTGSGVAVSGKLQLLSVDDWLGLIAEASESVSSGRAALGAMNRVDLHAGQLNALGISFNDVRLQLRRPDPAALQLSLDAPRVKGDIDIPVPLAGRGINSRFQRVHAVARDALSFSARDPAKQILDVANFPALSARIDDLRYDGLELGQATLSLRPSGGGIKIETMELTNPTYGVTGAGAWFQRDGRVQTELALRLQGKDLGRTLHALGYSDNGVRGAPVEVTLSGRWDGSPLAFSLSRMSGQLELRAGKGRFMGVEPSTTGRVFGLLSVTMLPRRLFRLDFSDLFGEGIGFRRIRGRFDVDGGNAYTNTFSLDADTAQVEIVGRVGLVSRDYDQVMTVIPKLSSSLPLAPLWLAEQVLDRKLLDPAFAYQYSITGHWDDPVIERIRTRAEDQELAPASAR